MTHSHNFKSWAFEESVDTGTFTTKPVLDGSKPILDVFHGSDGDWQFLCGTTLNFDDLKLVCLGCMVERDETLLEVADLPLSWRAFRRSPAEPWTREEYQENSDEV